MLEVLEDHLDADTQVDMFLSGGIDSSILAYLTKKKLNKELRHFSLNFPINLLMSLIIFYKYQIGLI